MKDDCDRLDCSFACRMSWLGPRCYCPVGKQPTGARCVDANECAVEGTCDQLCTDLPGTYKCGCVPGYKFVPPSSCVALNSPISQPPSLLVSTSDSIQSIMLTGDLVTQLRTMDSYAIDFNHRNESICWISHSSNAGAARPSSSLQCTNIQMNHGWSYPSPDILPLNNVNLVAFDWASGNWYYLDESRESIFLCRILNDEEQICKVVITTRMRKPRGIALDPSAGN